jgi:CubicO group peptidase (beta-lactamase class C family)
MARQKIPGLALLVARNGVPIRAEGFGLASVELHVPVKPETIFQSGSIGKQFTAAAVMMLVETGQIGLDDPIGKYFDAAPSWWSEVTVRELLSHTAGFTDYPENFDERKDYTEEQIIPNRSSGYRLENGQLKNQTWVAPALNTTADGSLYFSILDLAKWDAALYTERLLKRSSMHEMWTVATLRDGNPNSAHYGFGWFVESRNGHRVVEHDGKWQGFETQISRYLDDGLTVIVLTNLGDADPHRIVDEVAAFYFANARPGLRRRALQHRISGL